jgi:hypothetical protein
VVHVVGIDVDAVDLLVFVVTERVGHARHGPRRAPVHRFEKADRVARPRVERRRRVGIAIGVRIDRLAPRLVHVAAGAHLLPGGAEVRRSPHALVANEGVQIGGPRRIGEHVLHAVVVAVARGLLIEADALRRDVFPDAGHAGDRADRARIGTPATRARGGAGRAAAGRAAAGRAARRSRAAASRRRAGGRASTGLSVVADRPHDAGAANRHYSHEADRESEHGTAHHTTWMRRRRQGIGEIARRNLLSTESAIRSRCQPQAKWRYLAPAPRRRHTSSAPINRLAARCTARSPRATFLRRECRAWRRA